MVNPSDACQSIQVETHQKEKFDGKHMLLFLELLVYIYKYVYLLLWIIAEA